MVRDLQNLMHFPR